MSSISATAVKFHFGLVALGLDPKKQNMSNVGRPIRLADPEAEPIREILS